MEFRNFSSRFGYHTQQQTLETIEKFRAEKIPVDAIIFRFILVQNLFKERSEILLGTKIISQNPQQMIDDLRKNNVETILITEPFV